jgi:hypothetical protein
MLLTGIVAGVAMTAQAHHSWEAVYRGGQRVNDLTATIAGNHSARPHNAIAVTIRNQLGAPEAWTIQWRGGVSRDRHGNTVGYDFNIGDEVVIGGRMARDEGQKLIQMTSLVRAADGWTITAREGRDGGR